MENWDWWSVLKAPNCIAFFVTRSYSKIYHNSAKQKRRSYIDNRGTESKMSTIVTIIPFLASFFFVYQSSRVSCTDLVEAWYDQHLSRWASSLSRFLLSSQEINFYFPRSKRIGLPTIAPSVGINTQRNKSLYVRLLPDLFSLPWRTFYVSPCNDPYPNDLLQFRLQ